MAIEKIDGNFSEEIEFYSVLDKLDRDPDINRLLDKTIDEEDNLHGELIWPSNMIVKKGSVFKIDGAEFDRAIEKAKKVAIEDNDLNRVSKIEKIARRKKEIILLVKNKLEEFGYEVE